MIPIMAANSIDPDAQTHIARLTAPSDALKEHINTLVVGLKADELWDKLETVCVVHPVESESLFDLRGFKDSVKIGSPTFIADRGFTFVTGPAGYIDSQLTPYSNTVKFSDEDNSMFCYMRIRGTSTIYKKYLGSFTNSPHLNLNLNEGSSLNLITHSNASGGGPGLFESRVIGFSAGSRLLDSTVFLCHDGNTASASYSANPIPATNLYVGGYYDGGHVPWTDCQMAAWGFGSGMTGMELVKLYNRVLTYMTSRGANV